jgi:hypothetical protein
VGCCVGIGTGTVSGTGTGSFRVTRPLRFKILGYGQTISLTTALNNTFSSAELNLVAVLDNYVFPFTTELYKVSSVSWPFRFLLDPKLLPNYKCTLFTMGGQIRPIARPVACLLLSYLSSELSNHSKTYRCPSLLNTIVSILTEITLAVYSNVSLWMMVRWPKYAGINM